MLINSFRYCVEVARSGSLLETSEQLNVAISVLSRLIQNLGYELGMPLFERWPHSGAGNTMLPGRSVQREIGQGEVIAGPISDQTLNQCSVDVSVLVGHHIPTASSQFLAVLDRELMSSRMPRRQTG